MSNSKVSITGKQLLIVFFMGLAFAVVYATPFVQYVFYAVSYTHLTLPTNSLV